MDLLCDAITFNEPPARPDDAPESSSNDGHAPPPGLGLAFAIDQAASSSDGHSGNGNGNKTCHICGRTYERADHLNRHLKSHENQRAYKCNRCAKSFNRADLLNRHQASHDRPDKAGIERGDRVAAACVGCVSAKAKCQDEKPCERCRRRGIPCETSNNVQKSQRLRYDGAMVPEGNQALPFLPTRAFEDENQSTSSMMSGPDPRAANYGLAPGLGNANTVFYDNPQLVHDARMPLGVNPNPLDYAAGAPFDMDLGFVPRNAYFGQDIDFGLWDVDLTMMAETGFGQISPAYTPDSGTSSQPRTKDPAKRYAAFERSPWLWTPTSKDQIFHDHDNITVDEHNIPSVLATTSPAVNPDEFADCNITEKQRDQIMGLLFAALKRSTHPQYLPSLPLLNSLIQVYFVQQRQEVDHYIHSATFNPDTALPQLLIALVSAGSTFIATPAIWKMGLALQDVTRQSCGQYWEENNAHTRNLQSIQAFTTILDVGMWSGSKRNMEIAESFGQPIVIMLRRAGVFAATENSPSLIPTPSDPVAVLDAKWRRWSERESWKRLVLHLFMHDVQASIGFQKPPLIPFTEFKFPLPASRALWLARTATEWAAAFLASSSQPLPTWLEAMHQPDSLPQFNSRIDVELTIMVIVHAFWGQVWSLNESRKFFPISKVIHKLCLHTAYSELYRDVASLCPLIPLVTHSITTEATIICEVLLMTLHVGPEDLQRFAGKFGPEEARNYSDFFVEWAQTKEAKMAIWHAGQVFRAAGALLPAHLRAFNAVALYYACLTLWIYGLSCASPIDDPSSPSNGASALVILNEQESPQSRAFLAAGGGLPSINMWDAEGGATVVDLRDTDRVLDLTIYMYKRNFQISEGATLPPLVENLSSLLEELGSLPGGRVSRLPSES